jgi:hypothetical protein
LICNLVITLGSKKYVQKTQSGAQETSQTTKEESIIALLASLPAQEDERGLPVVELARLNSLKHTQYTHAITTGLAFSSTDYHIHLLAKAMR